MSHIIQTAVCAIVLIFAAIVSGLARYNFFTGSDKSEAVAYLNAVSTGVILAAAFTHLLPDSIENLKYYSYPLACGCALLGFLLLVVVETVLTYQTLEDEHKAAADSHSRHDCAEHNHENGSSPVHSFLSKGIPSSVYPRIRPNSGAENRQCYHRVGRSNSFSGYGSLEMPHEKGKPSHGHNHVHCRDHEHVSHRPYDHVEVDDKSYLLNDEDLAVVPPVAIAGHSHSHAHRTQSPDRSPKAVYAAVYTFWMALVVHSTMEGFGIGVADTFLEQLMLVIAILIHKVFESLAIAGLLIDAKLPSSTGLFMYGTFTCATPLGALFSAFVESYVVDGGHASPKVISGVITGMAAGSFMYIGTMEMLPHMLDTCSNMRLGMACFVLSAGAMAALAAVV